MKACYFTRGHHYIAIREWGSNPCGKEKSLLFGLSRHIEMLTVEESDPLQLVCKPEGRHARLLASTQSGAFKAAYGESEKGERIK